MNKILAALTLIALRFTLFTIHLNPNSILLMQDFDPAEWEHVQINQEKIHDLAFELVKIGELQPADWTGILPLNLDTRESVDYVVGLICIDFCHWGFKKKGIGKCDFFTTNEQGEKVRGSAAMSLLAKQAYEHGCKIFDASFMEKAHVTDLSPYFIGMDNEGNAMEIPWLKERVEVLNEVGKILNEKWGGSFYPILLAAKGKAFNQGDGWVELLVRDFPRFRDTYEYRDKKIGIYKLAQLSVAALQSALRDRPDAPSFSDNETLTLCADYQLPRSLRAFDILEYSPELACHIEQEQLIPYGSPLEIEVRMATVYAGEQLKKSVNDLLNSMNKPLITALELDYLLWSHGRQLDGKDSKHHLTPTIMY